jgi:putative ABC transport system permease protein
MNALFQGFRQAFRALRRSPAFALLAGATIALGVGASTWIFSLVYGVLWRPLPYPNAARLVAIRSTSHGKSMSLSYPDCLDLAAQSRSLDSVAIYTTQSVILTGSGEPTRLVQDLVSVSYFPILGLHPALGRDFTPIDDTPGAPAVAIISHGLWERALGGAPGLIGKSVTLDGQSVMVVGVMPDRIPSYDGDPPDLWSPIGPWAAMHRDDRAARAHRPGIFALGLARASVPLGRIQSELDVIGGRLERQYPASNGGIGIRAEWLSDSVVASIRPALFALLCSVALLLLIVCGNVAGLTIARAAGRNREIAIRAAIGASRGQIVRQLLRESVLLGASGGALGVLGAWAGIRVFAARGPASIPRISELGIDTRVLLFALAATITTTLLSGLLPALRASRWNLRDVLSSGDPKAGGPKRDRGRPALIGAEVALSFLLLTGSGLLLKSLRGVLRVNPGIDPGNVVTAQLTLSDSRYRAPDKRLAFYRQLLEQLRRTPGVEAAGMTNPLPFSGKGMQFEFVIEGRPIPSADEMPTTDSTVIDSGLPSALRIPLKSGRFFTESDDRAAPRVALINESMAKRFWPGTNPIGRRFSTEEPAKLTADSWTTIIGVVGNVKQYGLDRDQNTLIYLPAPQMPLRSTTLVVRSATDTMQLAKILQKAVRQIDPEQPVDAVRSMEELLGSSYASRRWATLLLSAFAAVAALLTAVGLYGVAANCVVRRTREIGVRMALGATARDVVRLVLLDSAPPVLFGIAAGAGAAFFTTRLLRALLFGVGPLDGPTFLSTAAGLAALALTASLVPLRRAVRLDPQAALRSE